MSLHASDGSAGRPSVQRLTAHDLQARKSAGVPIVALTAYDYPSARLLDQAGIDLVLVGDSLGMAVLGYADTLSVTMEEMLHHTRAVRRGLDRAFLVADMPYGSYQVSDELAVANALRFLKEAGAQAVKIEGGASRATLTARLTEAEIPVVGHIGLTPQSLHRMGGYRVQGKSSPAIEALCADALALQGAGAIALVLEGIPREVAARITAESTIPTIGIGAGPECDGQILVLHDLLTLTFAPPAKFVRRFGDASALILGAAEQFRAEVATHAFPADAESYHLPPGISAVAPTQHLPEPGQSNRRERERQSR